MEIQEGIVRRAFGHEFPKMDEIARNVSLVFVNSNQVISYAPLVLTFALGKFSSSNSQGQFRTK